MAGPPARFNSRPHVAGDLRFRRRFQHVEVSIHARTWRATFEGRHPGDFPRFQFTPARGGRHREAAEAVLATMFQFTPARGGRLGLYTTDSAAGEFQFTPARGGRPQKIVSFLLAEALQKACNADSIPFLPLIVCH